MFNYTHMYTYMYIYIYIYSVCGVAKPHMLVLDVGAVLALRLRRQAGRRRRQPVSNRTSHRAHVVGPELTCGDRVRQCGRVVTREFRQLIDLNADARRHGGHAGAQLVVTDDIRLGHDERARRLDCSHHGLRHDSDPARAGNPPAHPSPRKLAPRAHTTAI